MAQRKKHTQTATPTPAPTAKVEEVTAPTPAPTLEEKTEEESESRFEVETTGDFDLYDPIARLDIPHNKAIMVNRTAFIDRQLNLKRLAKVK